LFGYSRQAYYKHKSDRLKRQQELIIVRELVMDIRIQMPRIGTRKLYFLLKDEIHKQGIKIGRDVLFSFLRAEQLLIKPKRSYVKTTNSKHLMKKYPNLIENIEIRRPEQIWVSDITYIKTSNGHQYLSLVTDAYSKKIMGYALLDNLTLAGPLSALKMALANRRYDSSLIHHSDRGLQYCSEEYIKTLQDNNIAVSMTQNGDPYENAIAERMNGILKYEFLLIEGFKDHLQALQVIKESIQIYNQNRPHLSCNFLTPNEMHKQKELELRKWNKKCPKRNSFEAFN
jgi:transposase InsO family protein